jgi:hypothetical protein
MIGLCRSHCEEQGAESNIERKVAYFVNLPDAAATPSTREIDIPTTYGRLVTRYLGCSSPRPSIGASGCTDRR